MQISVISTWITSLYGSQHSSVVFSFKTRTIGPELKVSMDPRPHLLLCACKTARFVPEKLASVGPCADLLFLDAKQRLLGQNNNSLWVPAHICCFWMQNSDFWTRISSLNGSQTWPVILCMYNSVISTRITSRCGFHPSSVVLCVQNSDLKTKLHVSIGPRHHLSFCAFKTGWLEPEILVSMSPSPHL